VVSRAIRAFRSNEGGFSLIELLVAITVFAITATAFYTLLFTVQRGTDTAQAVARVSEEARLGFNRMVRDTREGQAIVAAELTPERYTVEVDFNADGAITPWPDANPMGDYEELTFYFNDDLDENGQIWLNDEILMREVKCVKDGSGNCKPVFNYSSNRLEYDWNSDGITTWQELDEAPSHGVIGVGNDNDVLDGGELPFISSVTFHIRVRHEGSSSVFYAEAQLRNRR
jgi:prepilin-type N-terminal cleavage/methylation domain-containing protein